MAARDRGAAYVGVTWFVVSLVLLFGALAGVAMQASQVTDIETAQSRAQQDARAAEDARDALEKEFSDVAAVVGFHDADTPGSHPKPEAAREALENLRTSFPTVTAEVKTVRDALPRLQEAYRDRGQKVETLEAEVRRLQGELKAGQDALATTTSQKDEEIQRLRKALDDANAKATNQVAELEGRIAGLRQQNREIDQQSRETKTASEKKEGDLKREIAVRDGRIHEMGTKLAPITKEPDRPDGRIVSVSEKLPIGYIDLGAKNRLQRGVRFQVREGGRRGPVKGWVEVEEVDRDQAQVRIYDVTDKFDPIVPGDEIWNPLYDPSAEKVAVLLGRFSGRLNKPQVGMLLENVGVDVREKVDRSTDFVVLGSPEEAELTGEGKPLAETEEYRKAETFGCQIVPLKAVEAFFRF
jgi:hypothetical protein